MKYVFLLLTTYMLLFIAGCKPDPYPKNPHYEIIKPKVRYTPNKKNLEKMVKQLQGSPYVWAEEGPDRFDCSGFTYYLYGSMGIEIPRVAREQAKNGKRISPNELQYGDLIFFATDKKQPHKITHVGIYLGDGWFTHASTAEKEVVYSNLFTSPYYKKRLRICRRYLPQSSTALALGEQTWQNKQTLKNTTVAKAKSTATEPKGKAIVIRAPIQQIEPTSTKGNFYVQVGSFVGRPQASILYNITRHGFKYKIIKFPKEKQTISKLLIGPYKTRSEALVLRDKIRTTIQKDAFIAEIR